MDAAELFKYLSRLVAVARCVISWVDRVYDSKLRVVLLCHWQRIERLVIYSVNSECAWLERIAVEVQEAHEQSARGEVGTLLQFIEVHIGHD